MFAASMADWLMFVGIVAALGATAAGLGWALREPAYPQEPESQPEAASGDMPEAA